MSLPTDTMAVDVYRNLNQDCLSVRSRESDTYGQVIAHVERAIVNGVEFVVQPAGRQRVLEDERKNVHAFVRGVWHPTVDVAAPDHAYDITYNPYEYDSFVTRTDELSVARASRAFVSPDGVKAVGVEFDDTASADTTPRSAAGI